MPRVLTMVLALLVFTTGVPVAAAQEASPMASPGAAECQAPADAALLERIRVAEENIAACITAGEYEIFATLLTANFRQQIFGTPDAAGIVAILAEVVFTANGEPNHVRDIYEVIHDAWK